MLLYKFNYWQTDATNYNDHWKICFNRFIIFNRRNWNICRNISIYLTLTGYIEISLYTPSEIWRCQAAIVTWLWRHEQVMYTVYKVIHYLSGIHKKNQEICFVIIFSGHFPFRKIKWFWLSTSNTTQLLCFTCIWNNPFNSYEQWSWSWFGIVLNYLARGRVDRVTDCGGRGLGFKSRARF